MPNDIKDTPSGWSYEATAQSLVGRILALIPEHREILAMDDAWGLFKVPGFKCDDLAPSFAQASAALAHAKVAYAKGQARQ